MSRTEPYMVLLETINYSKWCENKRRTWLDLRNRRNLYGFSVSCIASGDLIDLLWRRKNTSKSLQNSQVSEKVEKNSSKAFVKRGKIYECCLVSSAVALKLKCMCWRWRLTFSSRKLFLRLRKTFVSIVGTLKRQKTLLKYMLETKARKRNVQKLAFSIF